MNAGTVSNTIGLGNSNFPIVGGANDGKVLIVAGSAGTATDLFDPSTQASLGPGPTTTAAVDAGSFNIPFTRGTNKDKVLLHLGGTGPFARVLNLYDPITNSFSLNGFAPFTMSNSAPDPLLLREGVHLISPGMPGGSGYFFFYQ